MSSSTSHKPPRSRGAEDSGAGGGRDGGEGGGGGGGGGGGRLVKVAFARTEAEAELLQGLLMEEAGIPSVLQRSTPIPGAAYMPGPSNVMVAAEAAPRAREVLKGTFGETEEEEIAELEGERRLARGETGVVSPGRLAAGVAAAAAGAVALIWVLYEIT